MNIYYVTHARMPTEKAHGLTIAKSCESFAQTGARVILIVPKRANRLVATVFETYGVAHNFAIRFLPVLDLFRFFENRVTFLIQICTFDVSVFFFLLFKQRTNAIVYTREPWLALLTILGFKVVYECHHIFSHNSFFFWLSRRAYRIITISHALKDTFVRVGFDEKNILVAPSGVDISLFDISLSERDARVELDLPLKAKIALYTGNFTTMGEDKGIDDTIHAMTHVPHVVFVAVGGNEKDIARYRTLSEKVGVSHRVVLRGHTPQPILARYQRAADVLMMPFPDTPHYRNHMSPVKMFEYMASGVPIIASDLPTIREVLNEKNAMIVPPNDPLAIANAIQVTFDDSLGSTTRAGRARADVLEYSWENRTQRILATISTL